MQTLLSARFQHLIVGCVQKFLQADSDSEHADRQDAIQHGQKEHQESRSVWRPNAHRWRHPNCQFIKSEPDAGEDVEVCFSLTGPPSGAHCVHATGYSVVNGYLQLEFAHDSDQINPNAGVLPANVITESPK
jgi:hypothetical protein